MLSTSHEGGSLSMCEADAGACHEQKAEDAAESPIIPGFQDGDCAFETGQLFWFKHGCIGLFTDHRTGTTRGRFEEGIE